MFNRTVFTSIFAIRRWTTLAATAVLLTVTIGASAITVETYSPARHDRFYQGSDKNFLGSSLDLSGYTNFTSNTTHATLISDSWFITAEHSGPGVGSSVTFYRDDSLSGPSWTATHVERVPVGGDLAIGRLSSPAPSWVRRYPLVKLPSPQNGHDTRWVGLDGFPQDIFVVGRGHDPYDAQAGRVGRNNISTVDGGGPFFRFEETDLTFGGDEGGTRIGDSGGPTLISYSYGSALIGIHSGKNADEAVSLGLPQIQNTIIDAITVVSGLLGDFDLDFDVDSDDFGVFTSNYNLPGDLSQGDFDGDGFVGPDDFGVFIANYGTDLIVPDVDGDRSVTPSDYMAVVANWGQIVSSRQDGDLDNSGAVDIDDIRVFDSFWLGATRLLPPPPVPVLGDLDNNGVVGNDDWYIFANSYETTVTPYTNGDFDGDGFVGPNDSGVMLAQLGTIVADVNDDQSVDPDDVSFIAARLGTFTTLGRTGGDINIDGLVDETDLALVGSWWRTRLDSLNGNPSSGIPEPNTFMLICLSGCGAYALARRFRSS